MNYKGKVLLVVDGLNEKNGANSSFLQLLKIFHKSVQFSIITYGRGGVLRSLEARLNLMSSEIKGVKIARRLEKFDRDKFDHVFIMASIDERHEDLILGYYNSRFVRVVSFDVEKNWSATNRLKKFHKIICQNVRDYDYLTNTNEFTHERIYYVAPSVHPSDELRYQGAAQTRLHRQNLGSKEAKIVTIASVQERKNQLEIIEALKHYEMSQPFDFKIIGPILDRPYYEKCKRRVDDLKLNDKVSFVGFSSRWREYLDGADVCVIASKSEGLSNVVRYCMLMQKKLLINQELIDNSVLVDNYNCIGVKGPFIENFSGAMSQILNTDTSDACRQTYQTLLSNACTIRKFMELLNE